MRPLIRKATESDIPGILDIVNHHAARNLMLWRTPEQVRRVLDSFVVAQAAGRVVGCASLVELTPRLTELRSLAVAPEFQGHGLGGLLVETLVRQAREAGYDQVCALTLREGFFNRLGFATVDRWALTAKIWHECIYCPKFHACDEIAVLMNLREPVPSRSPRHRWPFGLGLWKRGLAWLSSKT